MQTKVGNLKIQAIVDSYMQKVPMVHEHCDRCLASARWHSNAVLMVVDAAFDSMGLNYFQSVVPKVELFRQEHWKPAGYGLWKTWSKRMNQS